MMNIFEQTAKTTLSQVGHLVSMRRAAVRHDENRIRNGGCLDYRKFSWNGCETLEAITARRTRYQDALHKSLGITTNPAEPLVRTKVHGLVTELAFHLIPGKLLPQQYLFDESRSDYLLWEMIIRVCRDNKIELKDLIKNQRPLYNEIVDEVVCRQNKTVVQMACGGDLREASHLLRPAAEAKVNKTINSIVASLKHLDKLSKLTLPGISDFD